MFNSIAEKTFYVYGALNLAWIPLVYLFWPETAKRSLESIDWLFESKVPFTWVQERRYRAAMDEFDRVKEVNAGGNGGSVSPDAEKSSAEKLDEV